ncbi:MAG: ankyrin repeat domain-containing protein [Gemmataceae bacterium]
MIARASIVVLTCFLAFIGGMFVWKPGKAPPPATYMQYQTIHDAAQAEDAEAMEWFFDNQPKDRPLGFSIDLHMYTAVMKGRVKIAELLLRRGANVNGFPQTNDQETFGHETLLSFACSHKQREMAIWLIKNGADVNIPTPKVRTMPLVSAIENRWPEVAFLIIEKQADLDYRGMMRNTALHVATKTNQADIVERLIDRGADINAPDLIGFTPLHHAASEGYANVVSLLIRKGADVNRRSYPPPGCPHGLAPLGLLSTSKHPACVRILKQNGGREY